MGKMIAVGNTQQNNENRLVYRIIIAGGGYDAAPAYRISIPARRNSVAKLVTGMDSGEMDETEMASAESRCNEQEHGKWRTKSNRPTTFAIN